MVGASVAEGLKIRIRRFVFEKSTGGRWERRV